MMKSPVVQEIGIILAETSATTQECWAQVCLAGLSCIAHSHAVHHQLPFVIPVAKDNKRALQKPEQSSRTYGWDLTGSSQSHLTNPSTPRHMDRAVQQQGSAKEQPAGESAITPRNQGDARAGKGQVPGSHPSSRSLGSVGARFCSTWDINLHWEAFRSRSQKLHSNHVSHTCLIHHPSHITRNKEEFRVTLFSPKDCKILQAGTHCTGSIISMFFYMAYLEALAWLHSHEMRKRNWARQKEQPWLSSGWLLGCMKWA